MRKTLSNISLSPFVTILLLFCIILLSFLYMREIQSKKDPSKPDPVVQDIRTFMLLPRESPQILTVEDVDKARIEDPFFFKDAQKGNKLIIYPYLTILYDPKIKKIINVKTLTPPLSLPNSPLRISFRYNGESKSRAEKLKHELEKASPMYHIIEIVPSQVRYKGDVIYLGNTKKTQDVYNFAKIIGDSPVLTTLESDERDTDADLIVAFSDTVVK